MTRPNAESRDDVMHVPELSALLREKTASEFHAKWEKKHPRPAIGMTVGTLAIAFALTLFGREFRLAATVFYTLTGLQVLWAVVIMAIRLSADTAKKQEQILMGHYPPEAAGIVLARLRWWNHLIVPKHWARHSRIHDRKYKLEKKMQELEKQINELTSAEEISQETLENLPDIDIPSLAARINTWAQRVEHETRIASIEESLPRLYEEYSLYKALHHKISKVTDKLNQIEKLSVFVNDGEGASLNEVVERALAILETRRQLVLQVDRVEPAEFLELVNVQ